VLARYRYAYDAAGNRTSEQIDDAVVGATYNSANELVSTQPEGGLYFAGVLSEPASVTVAGQPAVVAPDNTFSKTVPLSTGTNTIAIAATDPSGNTSTKSYQVSTSGSATSFTYDANGNLASDGTRSFTWDAEDRLISVTIGTHVSTFSYDGLDRRVEIVEADNGSTTSDTKFLWCGLALCEARNSSGIVLKRYFDEGVEDNSAAYFYVRDHLGSVHGLTDGSNTVRARYDYDAWGRRTKLSGDKDTEVGFTNHYQHAATGLILAPLRPYDPNLARWLTEDPAGMVDGPNEYRYVGGNPSSFIDIFGLDVTAVRDGTVFRAGYQVPGHPDQGLGWRVSIRSEDGTYDQYGHMDPNTTPKVGAKVKAGDSIGDYADPTNGDSSGPHVHYERRDQSGNIINPGTGSPILGGRQTTGFGDTDKTHPSPHQGTDWVDPKRPPKPKNNKPPTGPPPACK
jgi:RHS repeat-associated protein